MNMHYESKSVQEKITKALKDLFLAFSLLNIRIIMSNTHISALG